jgi:hypothetical protein
LNSIGNVDSFHLAQFLGGLPEICPKVLISNFAEDSFVVFLHGPRNIDGLLQQWKAKYGGIFTFWMGPIPVDILKNIKNGLILYWFK